MLQISVYLLLQYTRIDVFLCILITHALFHSVLSLVFIEVPQLDTVTTPNSLRGFFNLARAMNAAVK